MIETYNNLFVNIDIFACAAFKFKSTITTTLFILDFTGPEYC